MFPSSLVASSSRWQSKLPEYARRALHHDQMELDSALSQMYSLCTTPASVSKMTKARKVTKNHYYRDDPGFIVLQCFFLIVSSVVFGVALQSRILHVLYNILYSVAIDYFVVGGIAASATWAYANKFLMTSSHLHEVRREVEWQHSFDIHCNGYFPYFMITHVLQFALLPLLVQDTFLARLVANSMYTVALATYFYNTFRGYVELPMLARQQTFLYPMLGVVCIAVVATVTTSINMTHVMIHQSWPIV